MSARQRGAAVSMPPKPSDRWGAEAREVFVGPNVEGMGFLVPALPPERVVVRKVKPGTWASYHHVAEGDVLVEVGDREVADMLGAEFVEAMKARPLRLVFLSGPAALQLPLVEDALSGCSSSSHPGHAGHDGYMRSCHAGAASEHSEQTPRKSAEASPTVSALRRLSDWYAECDSYGGRGANERRTSLTEWYLDGQERPETNSELTVVHTMWRAGKVAGYRPLEKGNPDTPAVRRAGAAGIKPEMAAGLPAEALAVSLDQALRSEDRIELARTIAKAESAGLLADAVERARRRLAGLERVAS